MRDLTDGRHDLGCDPGRLAEFCASVYDAMAEIADSAEAIVTRPAPVRNAAAPAIYAASAGSGGGVYAGVYRSLDGGRTWSDVTSTRQVIITDGVKTKWPITLAHTAGDFSDLRVFAFAGSFHANAMGASVCFVRFAFQ